MNLTDIFSPAILSSGLREMSTPDVEVIARTSDDARLRELAREVLVERNA